ncbi:MAG: hypothetical protein RIB61_04185 [Roseicyclus sp.]
MLLHRRYWFIPGTIALSMILVAGLAGEKEKSFFWTSSCYSFGFFAIPLALLVCRRAIATWGRRFANFLRDDDDAKRRSKVLLEGLVVFEGRPASAVMFVCLGLCALLIYGVLGLMRADTLFGHVVQIMIVFMSAGYAGTALVAAIDAVEVIRVATKDIRVVVTRSAIGVMSMGVMLIKCYFMIVLAYIPYVCSAMYDLFANEVLDMAEPAWNAWPVYIFTSPTAFVLIFGFIAAQLPMHRAMEVYKHEMLAWVGRELRSLRSDEDGAMDRYSMLLQTHSEVERLPEWPVGRVAGSGILVTIVLALAPGVPGLALQAFPNLLPGL